MKIAVAGTGYVGMSIAVLLAQHNEVKAVDIDSMACRVARENIADNDLSDKIEVREGDLLHGTEGQADLIIANIIADIIIMFVKDVPFGLKEGGIFLTSGIITERAEDVRKAAEAAGLKYLHTTERGGWVVMEFTK